MIKRIALFIFMVAGGLLSAQETSSPEMADTFRQEGKIYVVIAVVAIIFVALAVFLFYIENKLGRLEKQLEQDGGSSAEKAGQARH